MSESESTNMFKSYYYTSEYISTADSNYNSINNQSINSDILLNQDNQASQINQEDTSATTINIADNDIYNRVVKSYQQLGTNSVNNRCTEQDKKDLNTKIESNIKYDFNSIMFWYCWMNNKLKTSSKITLEKEYSRERFFECYIANFFDSVHQDFIQATDAHGTLNSLLNSLLDKEDTKKSPCKFVDNEYPVVFYDLLTNKVIKTIKDIDNANEFDYTRLVLIPNLEINPQFESKWIFNGDLIDRGEQSESCICTMFNLLNQPNAEQKLIYLLGNHEQLFLERPYNLINCNYKQLEALKHFNYELDLRCFGTYSKNYECFYLGDERYICECTNSFFDYVSHKSSENNQAGRCCDSSLKREKVDEIAKIRKTAIQQQYFKLISQDKILFSLVIDDMLFSHTMLEKYCVEKIIETYYNFISSTDKEQRETKKNNLLKKIENIVSCDKEEYCRVINKISSVLNKTMKFYFINMENIFKYCANGKYEDIKQFDLTIKVLRAIFNEYCQQFSYGASGLFWKRDDDNEFLSERSSFLSKQLIGHVIKNDIEHRSGDQQYTKSIVYTDCGACLNYSNDYVKLIKHDTHVLRKCANKLLLSRQQLSLLSVINSNTVVFSNEVEQLIQQSLTSPSLQ